MAENPSNIKLNSFVSGMIQDTDDSFSQEGSWSYARNASKVTASGSLQTLSNEASTILCTLVPYSIIGRIHLYEDKWAICSTDNVHSEIGIFDDSECSYTPLKNRQGQAMNPVNCLNFNINHLIQGISKQNFDCTWEIYFADSVNPDRAVNVNRPQFIQICTDEAGHTQVGEDPPSSVLYPVGCIGCVDTINISCPDTRIASLVKSPCIKVSKSKIGGTILNGSYFVVIAYTVNDQVVTDYFPPSNIQSLFTHTNVGGSLDISFSGLDTTHFNEFQLVIVRTFNQQVSAKKIGIYSTQTQEISINNINEALPSVPIEQIPIRNPVYEKSDAVYSVGDYAIRIAPVTKFDFNYQPLANRIQVKWVSVEYPSDYYRNGGNNTGYMRDEIYAFFVRFIYDTGDRSSSYHIPGRAPIGQEVVLNAGPALEHINTDEYLFETINTASLDPPVSFTLPDGGIVISQGPMGYWQSSEKYPDNRADIWDSSYYPWSNIPGGQDLCAEYIRHHKMPDNMTDIPGGTTNHINDDGTKIRIIGVKFDNIRVPVDNNGVPIPGIVGYEILRGSREGNKTIIAKGILNNMRGYVINGSTSTQPQRQGLYQNYPYNFQGSDITLRTEESKGGYQLTSQPGDDLTTVHRHIFTFHSPDTQFKHPYLSTNELKIYGHTRANITGNFEAVPYHPKEKLLGDLSFIVAAMVGIGEGILAMRGQRTHNLEYPSTNVIGQFADVPNMHQNLSAWTGTYTAGGNSASSDQAAYKWGAPNDNAPSGGTEIGTGKAAKDQLNLVAPIVTGADDQNYSIFLVGTLISALLPTPDENALTEANNYIPKPGLDSHKQVISKEDSKFSRIPTEIRENALTGALNSITIFSYYWTLGTDTTLRLIEAIIPFEQYSCRYLSHGYYNFITGATVQPGYRRFKIQKEQYLESQRQSFQHTNALALPVNYEINNLYRGGAVILGLDINKPVPGINPLLGTDNSLTIVSEAPSPGSPGPTFNSRSLSDYAAIIQRFSNQYGQLDSIQQLNIGCKFDIDKTVTDQFTTVIFGGDTYVSRYTEKNTFFYFYDWLMNQPDGYETDYRKWYMLTYPRYWANFTRMEPSDYLGAMVGIVTGGILGDKPSERAALDDAGFGGSPSNVLNFFTSYLQFRIKPGYFYIFQSGVRDFYVESEVNTDLRDYGDVPEERFYDPYEYAALESLFDPKIIKAGNYYKYDYSLSVSRIYTNFSSWGNLQPRFYDPQVAETCYVRRPNRLIYSLPQNTENTKDYWKVYLANNYRDFDSEISVIKPTAKNGAIILFKADSPLLFQGVDQLQTDLGTKVTLGDGGLFSQAQQSIINVDASYEYGSCQDRLSVINTPFGLFYMCTNQGKIFKATNKLDDITYSGLKFWFREYLPMKLLVDFPEFDILDNPLAGIGCQAIYDNQTETIYFCKRDFKLRTDIDGTVVYIGNSLFSYTTQSGTIELPLGDPLIFQDASFTVSFDPKSEKGGWISFHDWHPSLNIPSKNNFLTTKDDSIWRHNSDRGSFCKYYDQQYPFAVEYIYPTPNVNTLRSIEYYLECYKYAPGRLDRFLLLDFNFDKAIIYNNEQVSGVLNMKINPKNDPFQMISYPKLNLVPEWEVLYSKEENKYRLDTFWDITRSRGEFAPYAKQMIWITEPNGYIRNLNSNNLDYNKEQLQRKKFRHYVGRVYLEKKNPGEANMTIKVVQTKLLESIR